MPGLGVHHFTEGCGLLGDPCARHEPLDHLVLKNPGLYLMQGFRIRSVGACHLIGLIMVGDEVGDLLVDSGSINLEVLAPDDFVDEKSETDTPPRRLFELIARWYL